MDDLKQQAGLDIDDQGLGASKDYAECEIFNTRAPDTPSTGIFIEVWSRDSDHFKAAAHKLRRQAANAPGRRIVGAQLSREEEENLNVHIAVASVRGWRGVKRGGSDLECTPQNVEDVFRRYPLVQEQVFLFSIDRGNF
jgi:hypothetical protein